MFVVQTEAKSARKEFDGNTAFRNAMDCFPPHGSSAEGKVTLELFASLLSHVLASIVNGGKNINRDPSNYNNT